MADTAITGKATKANAPTPNTATRNQRYAQCRPFTARSRRSKIKGSNGSTMGPPYPYSPFPATITPKPCPIPPHSRVLYTTCHIDEHPQACYKAT